MGVVAVLPGLVLAAVLGCPGRALAEPTVVADGALRVEVAEGVDDAEQLPGWIEQRHPELARRLAEGPGRQRWIEVEIEGQYLDFRHRVVAIRDGQVVDDGGGWVECACSNDDLLLRLDERIEAAVERLREPEATPPGPDPAPVVEPPPVEPPVVDVEYRRITGIGVAGIVVGSLGVGALATGGVLVGLGERVPGDYQHLTRDNRPPGVALLVSGGVLLGGGVAMLVVDLVQCGRRHPRCAVEDRGETGVVRVRPWIGARGVGLTGRF